MLYFLHDHGGLFRLFDYVTFRAAMAGFTALILGFLIAPKLLAALRHLRQPERDGKLMGELAKEGGKVPTMGGLLILFPVLISTLLWARLDNSYLWAALVAYAGMSAVGWWDDYRKVVKRNPDGISGREKLSGQLLSALAAFAILASFPESRAKMCELWVPFEKNPVVSAETPELVRGRLESSDEFRKAKPEAQDAMVAARTPVVPAGTIPAVVTLLGAAAALSSRSCRSGRATRVNLTDGSTGLPSAA